MNHLSSWRPRAGARASWLAVTALASLGAQPQDPPAKPYVEKVEVERVVVDAHVIDRFSVPIHGLTAADFVVEVDGQPVPLESAEWIGVEGAPEESAAVERPSSEWPGALSEAENGRLLVILFQWELASQKAVGFLRMQRQAIEFARRMEPGDRVAIFLYDSHLWLRQDFTEDPARVEDTIRQILRQEEDRSSEMLPGSLAARLSPDQTRDATSIEKALAAIGDALIPISGKKSLLFFGFQMENWYGRMTANYHLARQALADAETSVFVLDVSDGRHRLAGGLQRIARDTGGLYMESFDFPRFAMRAVERALTGYYVLVFRAPPGPRGEHEIAVRLADREGTVTHRRFYRDGAR